MKACGCAVLTLFVALALVGCDNQSEPIVSPEISSASLEKPGCTPRGWLRGAEELADRFVESVRNKDIEAFMDCWWNSPDALLVLENGSVVQGYDNIRGGAQALFDAHETLDLVVSDVERFRLGDEVYAVGTATWTRTLKPEYGGGTIVFVERWTDVARRIHGKWVYVVDHAHDLTPFSP